MTIFPSIPIRRFAAAAIVAVFATAASAQTFQLSLDEGRVAAREATLAGNFALARDLANALLEADPNDRAALIVLAAAQPQLGQAGEGRAAGARAFRLSQSDAERYEAARLTALAAANEERYTLSQYWLRRAAINAPDDAAFAQTQRDYRGIRNLNPWSFTLGLSITPSNNVNGGSETEYNIIDGLPFVGVLSGDAQALPGIAASADARLGYTLSRSPNQQTRLTARAYARSVWLSDEARDISPTSENADFGSQVLEFGLTHDRRLGPGALNSRAIVGASWFGQELSRGYLRGDLGYGMAVTDRLRLTISGEYEQSYDPQPWTQGNRRHALRAGLSYRTVGGNRLSGQVGWDLQTSDGPNERYDSLTAQVSYALSDPIGPLQLSMSAGASVTQYPDYQIILPVPGGREDVRVFGSVTATLPELNYAGFVPVVTLGIQDTSSNVSRFERNEYSFSLGFRSSF